MLKITEQPENEKTLRLRLDGIVDSTTFAALQSVWTGRNDDAASTVILDMAGVTFMSAEAAIQLAELAKHSVHFVNCSPFIEMLLQSSNH